MKRRTLLGSAIAALALPAVITSAKRAAASTAQLTVVSWGGSYQDAQSKALFQPAAKALGITVKEETYSGLAELELHAKTHTVTWDVVSSGSGTAARAGSEGILEKLDYGVIDVADFLPGTAQPYFVGGDVFSTVVAWNTKTYGENGPQNWVDFWDVKKFPGARSYRNAVTLELPLIADGVPMDQVYEVLSAPGGMTRAIKKLAELKPHIAVWWSSGAQSAQLMKDGAVDMIAGWNGRFDDAAKAGAKVAYTFNQGMLDYDCFVIPKGAPHGELAMKFLAEISKPQYQAALTRYITYSPTNKKAFELGLIPADYAKRLPSYPANAAKQFLIDDQWYLKYYKEATEAYQNMMTK
ncbi:MAG: polyamine ABC transporter substrate-binding protein [Acetobacteraceae bacterium]